MPTVKLIEENQASPEVQALYEQIKKLNGGQVPPPMKAMANSVEYLKSFLQTMQAIMGYEEFDEKTKMIVALTVSTLNKCDFCIQMYTKKLKEAGFTDKQFVQLMGLIGMVSSVNHFNNGLRIVPE